MYWTLNLTKKKLSEKQVKQYSHQDNIGIRLETQKKCAMKQNKKLEKTKKKVKIKTFTSIQLLNL